MEAMLEAFDVALGGTSETEVLVNEVVGEAGGDKEQTVDETQEREGKYRVRQGTLTFSFAQARCRLLRPQSIANIRSCNTIRVSESFNKA